MDPVLSIFQLIVFIFAVVVHEVSHGLAALYLGDPTAKYAGRLTFNPFAHLDLFGSFLVPLLLMSLGAPVIGWAKPVPFNPYNLKNQKYGPGLVALAGPLANFLLALAFCLLARGLSVLNLSYNLIYFFIIVAFINIILALFNSLPIPPLDGSKILFTFLPISDKTKFMLESYGLFFAFLLLFALWRFVVPFVFTLSAFFIEFVAGEKAVYIFNLF